MWSHIFLFGSLPRRRPPEFTAILMFEFWREATATSVPGLLCQSRRRRPENVSFLSSLMTRAKDSTTRRHGTDATKIIGNNQITRRTIFEVKKCFQGHEMWLSIMSPMWRHTHVSGYFLIGNVFFCGYSFRPHVSGESARHTNPQLFESAL